MYHIGELFRRAIYYILNQLPFPYGEFKSLPGIKSTIDAKITSQKKLPKTFSFLTWNIEKGRQLDRLNKNLDMLRSDVMLLQEAPIKAKPHFIFQKNYACTPTYFCYQTILKKEGKISQSRYVFNPQIVKVPTRKRFNPYPRHCYAKRSMLYTQFKTVSGTLGVYNVHLENYTGMQGRVDQIKQVFVHQRKQKDTYIIIAGDFNTILGKYEKVHKFLQKHLVLAETKGNTCSVLKLDHIYHSKNMQVQAEIVKKKGSDHYPVQAKIKLL